MKIHGHKHTFEAQTLTERDGWFVAVEKAIVEAKESKDAIESSEAYKEEKTKLGKFVHCCFISQRVASRILFLVMQLDPLQHADMTRRQAHHTSGRYHCRRRPEEERRRYQARRNRDPRCRGRWSRPCWIFLQQLILGC